MFIFDHPLLLGLLLGILLARALEIGRQVVVRHKVDQIPGRKEQMGTLREGFLILSSLLLSSLLLGFTLTFAASRFAERRSFAVEAAVSNPSAITAVYLNFLNDAIDLDAKRVTALEYHIVPPIWILIISVSSIVGLIRGVTLTSRFWLNLMILIPITIAVGATLIANPNAPGPGLIRLDWCPLRRLEDEIGRADNVYRKTSIMRSQYGTAVASYETAISSTITNPTINDFSASPLQLRWSVSEAQAIAYTFAKVVMVTSNINYAPVAVLISCDSEIEDASPFGISMGAREGYANNDRKVWYVSLDGPPVTPDSPLTILLQADTPFKVLDVRSINSLRFATSGVQPFSDFRLRPCCTHFEVERSSPRRMYFAQHRTATVWGPD